MKRACFLLLLAATACARITQDNYLRIEEGMSEHEVNALLGAPAEAQSFNAFGVSSTTSRWVGSDATITVRFINGKARIKTYDKPPRQ
ncbi:MAG: hypothetical protein ABR570_09380 [Burkholderiales bacterium]